MFSLIAFSLLVLVLSWLIVRAYRQLTYFRQFGIPSPVPMPFLGNLIGTVLGLRHLTDDVRRIYNCDDGRSLYVGAFKFSTPVIVLRDIELIKKVAIKDFDHFTDINFDFDANVDPLMTKNLMALKGEKWREVRNLLAPNFTSSKIKDMYEPIWRCADNVADYLDRLVREQSENCLDTRDLFTRYHRFKKFKR